MEARTRLAPCQSPSGALTGCATKRAVFDSASRPIPSSLCPSRRSVGKSGPEPPSSGSFCFVGRQQAACDQRQLRRFVLGQMLQRSLAVALPDLRKIRSRSTSSSTLCRSWSCLLRPRSLASCSGSTGTFRPERTAPGRSFSAKVLKDRATPQRTIWPRSMQFER
jgi:hypothetical protein